ncbi:plasmid recombination protein [Vibrio parahaemolyticus]|nr:plasmid recombination protein [Vibrio parahaemolyticus]EKL0190345.1 plasmid recombination protein [Vibrio parahaemolyticus]EME0149548.1 plasmid recombination protein [Vibrio parahaemolyticus]EME0863103.1 plasmid recombination protein [Vibrio parahaemolyticus]
MGYQFIHIETYAKVASRSHKKQSARAIAHECERVPKASSHIKYPSAPSTLFGVKPTEAVRQAETNASIGKDKIGRKVRKDAQIIVAGIASYPTPTVDLNRNSRRFKTWLKLTHEFLKEKYGRQYKSLVLHLDEPFPHVHFYVVPDLNDRNVLSISSVHEGIKAREELPKGASAKEKMRAYKAAMRRFQDKYFITVASQCGLTRDGPRRRRLTRQEWQYEKAAAIRLSKTLALSKKQIAGLIASKELLHAQEMKNPNNYNYKPELIYEFNK